MKISLNSISFVNKKYGSAGDPALNGVDDLVERIGAQLGAVEDVEDYGAKYAGVVVVRVVSCEDHPNADRLHVCKVDDGRVVENIERDENGYVQVVCGAPNVREGLLVAWLPPRSTVPETYHHEAPFVLSARELRGVVSNGMLASAKELGLSDDHAGILEIEADVQPGTSFAKAYSLDDYIIDIENKMFTHRPDCFGSLGVAREIEGIYQRPYKSPDWYRQNPQFPAVGTSELKLAVTNDAPELVPRFTAIVMSNIKVGPSPAWLQSTLIRLGSRPINNIVDLTNFFMLETGQPLHAYDYDKVKTGQLGVRMAHDGEKLNLLNGKQAELTDKDVVITDGERAIGLGGVMGGADTEVDGNTKNIIIECANFDMYAIRRTSMRHGLFTDAVTRFNKGQSPLQNLAVLAKIVGDIEHDGLGQVASEVVDDNHLPDDMLQRGSVHAPVNVGTDFINARLGLELSADEIKTLLENVEFSVDADDKNLTVKAPFWRTDIEIPEDIVEEIGRLYGYDRLPLVLPKRDITPAARNHSLDLKNQVRQILARSGANELLTYSFVHGNLLERVGQDPAKSFQLNNALSPDLQYYRQSVLPSLLEKIHLNIKAGYDELAIFEIGKGHMSDYYDDQDLPVEIEMLDFVYAANDKTAKPGAAYYQAREYLQQLANGLHLEIELKPVDQHFDDPVTKPFDSNRSAYICIKNTDKILGVMGELRPSVRKSLKLPVRTAVFHVNMTELLHATANVLSTYHPLSRFPGTSQDICFRVSNEISYAAVYEVFETVLRDISFDWKLEPVDIYQGDDTSTKQITIRVTLNNPLATLKSDEVQIIVDRVIATAQKKLNAQYI